ncbi:hypothetical protein KI387_020692, partial [Taxus chinensis]
MDSNGPHALASRKGEGPPMAPPGWKWSTGKRTKDIIFVAPEGVRFRSKVALTSFLANYPNPPAEDEFLWRVKPSDFRNVPLPGVEKKRHPRGNIKSLSKEIQKQRRPQKRKSKIQQHENLKQDTRAPLIGDSSISGTSTVKTEADIEQDMVFEIPMSHGRKRKRPLRHELKACQSCGPLGDYVGCHVLDHHGVDNNMHGSTMKQKGSKHYSCHTSVSNEEIFIANLYQGNHAKDRQSIDNHSARLHEAARVLHSFLIQSGELKKRGDIQVNELYKILLNLQVTRDSMKTFPMNVVRAFVLLTRNEAAPSTLGRRALVRLCTKWYCKYKRFWCLLEEHRIDSSVENFIRDTSSLYQLHAAQSKSEAQKYQCMVDPFVEGQHVDYHSNANSVPETNLKVFGISDYSNTAARFGGSCYKNKPCKKCKQYQAIRDAFTNFSSKELQTQRDLANKSVDICDNPIVGAGKQNTELLFPTPNKKSASEEPFLTNKTRSYSSVHPGNEADRKNADLSNDESLAMHDQKFSPATIDYQYVNSQDLFDVNHVVDAAGYEKGIDNFLGNGCLDRKNDNSKAKLRSVVEIANCNCKSCCANVHFCPGCMCYVCHLSIQPDETWSYIKCSCHHIFHLECTLKERIGGVVEDKNIDGEFLCPVCTVKCDLFPFWRERLKNALENESTDIVQKHLKSAISAMDGTQRKSLKDLNIKVLDAYESVTYTPFSDLQRLLVSILEGVNMLKIAKEIDGFLERSFEKKEIELLESEKLVNLTKRMADRDAELYKKSQEFVGTRIELLAQVQENLKKAEVEMQLADQNAQCSSRAAKKARKRLKILQWYHKPQFGTKKLVEVQRKMYEREVSELIRIQRMIRDINFYCEESLPELGLLLETMKQQRQKVEVAHRKMEEM